MSVSALGSTAFCVVEVGIRTEYRCRSVDGLAALKYLIIVSEKNQRVSAGNGVMKTYTKPFTTSTPAIPPTTSHSPDVRKCGTLESAEVNRAMWLYPSGVGTISKYASVPENADTPVGTGCIDCSYRQNVIRLRTTKHKKLAQEARTNMFDPPVVTLLSILSELPDSLALRPGREVALAQVEQHDVAVVGIAVDFFEDQRVVPDPCHLSDDAVIYRVTATPVQSERFLVRSKPRCGILIQKAVDVKYMHGNEGVVVAGLGVLHRHFGGIWDDGVGILGGVVDRERELGDRGFIERQECDFGRVGRPPKGEVRRKDFLFIHPVRYTMEEGGIACVRHTYGASVGPANPLIHARW